MGGGYSNNFTGTAGAVGEHEHYQSSFFDELPARTKSNDISVGVMGGSGGASTAKLKQCHCCEEYTLPAMSDYEMCTICGWIDDPHQNADPDSLAGKNPVTLTEARKQYSNTKN